MAAFSHQYQPFLVDSSSYQYQPHISTTALLPPHHFHIHQDPSISISDTAVSFVKNQSPENSMVVDKLENCEHWQVTQKVTAPMGKKRRSRNGSSLSTSSPLSKDSIEGGSKKQKKRSGGVKGEDKKNEEKKDQNKNHEEPPTGYIHVRARRGQATDSHSLAERVRREKISERMKMLQKLVPGCDKVTGKALVLDEIINYVQSLQNQVEFLSMKLASVNPIFFDLAMDDIDTLLVSSSTPDQKLKSIASPSPPLPSNQATAFADTTTTLMTTTSSFPAANNDYDLLDYSSPIFQQGQRSNFFLEHTGGPFWDAEDQRQKLLNPYGFGNNTCSLN